MLAKDIIKHSNASWAVIGRTSYVDKRSRTSGNVHRSSCEKVELVDTKYYNRSNRLSDDPSSFTVASSAEKSKGFLVSYPTATSMVYRVVPSADFIGLWAEMETIWSVKEAEANKAEAERERKRNIERLATQSLEDNREEVERSAKQATERLLGADTKVEMYVNVTGEWNEDFTDYKPRLGGRVTLSFSDYQRLLEKVFEAQDALA